VARYTSCLAPGRCGIVFAMRSSSVFRAMALALTVAAAGCSGSDASDSTHTTSTTEATTTTATGAAAETCDAATPIGTGPESDGPEVQGIGTDATLYGLVFLTHPAPVRDGDELKIVWRMTGQGDLTVTSTSPTGAAGVLTFGPEPHTGSSYNRPGDEWGTGFLFDEPGCWQIHLQRTVGSADVWIDVGPAI
jgi:hypothetical protein